MSLAYRCGRCDQAPEFRLERRGDAVVSWACMDDVAIELIEMRRDNERTEIVVTEHRKP